MGKVIFLEEYLRTSQSRQRELLAKIEGHLAQAGLLGRTTCLCGRHQGDLPTGTGDSWLPWESVQETDEPERKS